ncbi:MAG TPA: O-antigen ligase family protein [Abditibacteriaceae bacterium]|nr:O-antigen ligase family protein [Abditibacteriaceae bacterium]
MAKPKPAARTHPKSHLQASESTALLEPGMALPLRLTFVVACLLLLLAPRVLSGFWPSTYDYQPQATFLAGTACVCLLMALRPRPPRNSRRTDSVAALLILCFGWMCLSVATGVYLHDALLEITRVGASIVWFFIIRALIKEREEATARHYFYIMAAITGGAVLVSVPAISDFIQTKNPRQFSAFYNPNLFANYGAMALPLALAWGLDIFRVKPKNNALPKSLLVAMAVLSALIIALGLLVTSSKGGALALLAGVLMFLLALWRAQGRRLKEAMRARRTVVAVVALVLIIAGSAVASRTVLPRLQQLQGSDDNSTMFRYYTWRGTLRMAAARPILGWGPGSYPSAYPQFAITGYTRSAHQLWLQIAAENGWLALLCLAGACVAAGVQGWRGLRGTAWPTAAGGLGALAAFVAHGFMDAGWGITSIALLLLVVLALLDTTKLKDEQPKLEPNSSLSTHHASLNWPWLALSLLLGLAAAGTQRAVLAEDLRAESRQLMKDGNLTMALQKARLATASDPLSARMWSNRGQVEAANGRNPRFSFSLARRRQPTRATHLRYLAEAAAEKKIELDVSPGVLFDQAVALDPHDTSLRLARAAWLLRFDDARGWQDLAYIAGLADQPYGRYPATPEFVNLDFAEAYAKLAARALRQGQKSATSKLIERGLNNLARWRQHEPRRREVAQETGTLEELEREKQRLEALEAQLRALQNELKK